VKYTYDIALLAEDEMLLQGMSERLTEIGRRCGMEMNVEKTKAMRISRQQSQYRLWLIKATG
jgi:hypothetical protein